MAHHSVVYHDPGFWAATPANNGGNGPTWQWGDELLIGFTRGTFLRADKGHQCTYDQPFESHLARSTDDGASWTTWQPSGYAGNLNPAEAQPLRSGLDFSGAGFVLRAEGAGYHGNRAARWFHSDDRGASWHGPHAFTGLLDHPELAGKEFTARTSYFVDGPRELSLFLTVRRRKEPHELGISLQEKTFLARTGDGGVSFRFVAWAVPWEDPYRAAMPAAVRQRPDHGGAVGGPVPGRDAGAGTAVAHPADHGGAPQVGRAQLDRLLPLRRRRRRGSPGHSCRRSPAPRWATSGTATRRP